MFARMLNAQAKRQFVLTRRTALVGTSIAALPWSPFGHPAALAQAVDDEETSAGESPPDELPDAWYDDTEQTQGPDPDLLPPDADESIEALQSEHCDYTMTPGGSALTVGTTPSNPEQWICFDRAEGQRISIVTTDGTYAHRNSDDRDCYLVVWEPDATGGSFGTGCTDEDTVRSRTVSGEQFDRWAGEEPGEHRLRLTGNQDHGQVTIQLYDVPEDSQGEAPFGETVTVQKAVPGHHPSLTFYGFEGERVGLDISAVSGPDPDDETKNNCGFDLIRENGFPVSYSGRYCFGADGEPYGNTTLPALPESGQYTLMLGRWDDFQNEVGQNWSGSVDIKLTRSHAQFIHHNIYGNIGFNAEETSGAPLLEDGALAEIRGATRLSGLPAFAYSLNEACFSHTSDLRQWLFDEYGVEYSMVRFEQARSVIIDGGDEEDEEISVCGESPSGDPNNPAGQYGLGLLTVGPGHEASAFEATYSINPVETRGVLCMPTGLTGTKGIACNTHLERGTLDCTVDPYPDPPTSTTTPPECDEGSQYEPKYGQFREFYDLIKFWRSSSSVPVHFAGDFYLTQSEMVGESGFSWDDNKNADSLARTTDYNDSEQIDHIVGESGDFRRQQAIVLPLEPGDLSHKGEDPDDWGAVGCPETAGHLDGGAFCSDHRLVMSYVEFDV